MKQNGILIMTLTAVTETSMPRKALTPVNGLVQDLHLIHVKMNLPVIRVLTAIVNTLIPVMTVMVTV